MITMRSKFGRVIAAVAVIAGLLVAWSRYSEAERQASAAENDAKAQIVIRSLTEQLRPGSPETDVIAYLRSHHPRFGTWPSENAIEYVIDVGKEPSEVWGCGVATVSVVLLVERARLARTRTTRWSTDCL